MASEAPENPQTTLQDRGHSLSRFIPFILGFRGDGAEQERGRIILVNPLTQGMVVIEEASAFASLLRREMAALRDVHRPASRASIEAMPCVEVAEGDEECSICLEEWVAGGSAKEMPCKHRFHEECVGRWLGIHGSCPVCRFQMPVEEDEGRVGKKREVWISVAFNGGRQSREESNQTVSHLPSTDSVDSTANTDHDMAV